jgi:hypothetical protein
MRICNAECHRHKGKYNNFVSPTIRRLLSSKGGGWRFRNWRIPDKSDGASVRDQEYRVTASLAIPASRVDDCPCQAGPAGALQSPIRVIGGPAGEDWQQHNPGRARSGAALAPCAARADSTHQPVRRSRESILRHSAALKPPGTHEVTRAGAGWLLVDLIIAPEFFSMVD